MEKKRNRIRKMFGNRVFWGIICFILNMYFFIAVTCGFHNWKEIYLMYVDGWTFWPIFMFAALVIYMARMEKDFFRGFKIAFSRQVSVSRMELQKAVSAMGYAEKAVVFSGVLSTVFPLVDLFYYMNHTSMTGLGPALGVLSLKILYPAILLLVLLPVRARLEQMVVSYMQEPEDSEEERKEAEGQRLYFSLRAAGLTDRETEVARLAASGMSNVEIGRELYISVATVKKHMTHILEKTQCADREALADRVRKI